MRTFILGVGAQKSGTTWLSKQLGNAQNYVPGLMKEYHVFDTLHLGGAHQEESKILKKLKNFSRDFDDDELYRRCNIVKSFYESTENYYNFFDEILAENNSVTADITPIYAGLSNDVFLEIRKQFELRGIKVKIIFFMREPITRIESAVKMGLRREGILRKVDSAFVLNKITEQLNSPADMLRANYPVTSMKLESAFPTEDIFYGFYETLFSVNEQTRLAHFLGLTPQVFDTSKKINSTPKLFSYNTKSIENLRVRVENRYQFVADKFNFNLSIWDHELYKLCN